MRELGDEWERGRWRPPSLATAAGKVKSLASVRWRARNTGRVDIGDSSDGGSCDWRREERRRRGSYRRRRPRRTTGEQRRRDTAAEGCVMGGTRTSELPQQTGEAASTTPGRGEVRRVRSVGSGAR